MVESLKSILCRLFIVLVMVAGTQLALGNPPVDEEEYQGTFSTGLSKQGILGVTHKALDQPNPKDYRRLRQRQRLLSVGTEEERLLASSVGVSGTDLLLVILVEFGGTDTFTWTPGVSTWDPIGKADSNEWTGTFGDCSNIITEERTFTYSGPLHNQIPRPLSAEDRSGDMIWTPNFGPGYYRNIIFGDGVILKYKRQDGSEVYQSFLGKSVNKYFRDLSGGTYKIAGTVVGWLQVPHSIWWYGADTCPGSRSGARTTTHGAIPGAGSARSLVIDALEAVKAAYPTFNWAQFDQDNDGVIDRLWIIHAGLGEEDSTVLLNRTDYGEATLWSHSSTLSPYYEVVPGIYAGPYIMMPENSGIGVLAHEFAHNLGAIDLYAYNGGETSAGFWTLMADNWTGYPIGFQPPALDPYHLDAFGWLNPYVVDDPTKIHTVKIGQASKFPGLTGMYRGVKIPLPDGMLPLSVQPTGNYQWWGTKEKLVDAMMTTKNVISIPGGGATLTFDLAYDIEEGWDFLWIQASADGGTTWTTLTNTNTVCNHESGWIGSLKGFPEDLCSAGIGGFTGASPLFPSYATESFNLDAFAGQNILLRFWYMTDSSVQKEGPFIDNIAVTSGGSTLFSDDAENGNTNWDYEDGWSRNDGNQTFAHSYYLQWRNVKASGGYDSALGDSRWRFGPANTGLLIWYNNNYYDDNEIMSYLNDEFGFGPKGKMLVVDAHPEPYRDPYYEEMGYENEGANVSSRSLMRDAPFSLLDSVDFTMKVPYVYEDTNFSGRPAVSLFDDSLSYYPGAEYVSRGPGYNPAQYIWCTKQWDASVAIPSTLSYGITAPGYTANTGFRFRCSRSSEGKLSCYWYSEGLGYDGGEGTPGSVGGSYGWKVKVLKQSNTSAKVKIWNSLYAVAPDLSGQWTGVTETCQPVLGGQKCKISGNLTISNSGALNAPVMYVNLYLSEDESYDRADRMLKQMELPSVAAGGALNVTVNHTLPLNMSASGKHVIAVIDPGDKIGEVDESNNEAAFAIP